MAHTSSFRKIDIANWPRKSYYEFFINNHDEGFSITADVDISLLLKQTKAEGLKFYPSFIYATSHVLNKYDDFKLGLHDGELVCWDKIVPSYPIFHDDSKLFSCLWVDYFEDFKKFYLNYLDNTERFKNCTGFYGQPDEPENCYILSNIPWVSFKNLSIFNHYADYNYFPRVICGKYYTVNEKTLLPISVSVQHATCDGYHIGVFFDEMQKLCDSANLWLKL
ncbi:CatA-like O-acetyltransferase [Candidatus Methanomassiliicoccus intestinalis]|uniref:CatA-like O-acetyltransferase n=1 Tax=Candidatus Methanomassiliicoccus intestinalis TaxID=1406512 RepID=UPI0037DDC874